MSRRWLVVAAVLAGTTAGGRMCAAEPGAAVGSVPLWELELREMGYLFLHVSNINVVNGLNLTRDQAVRLRDLAREVEQAAPAPPVLDDRIDPEWAKVRQTWLGFRDLQIAGRAPPAGSDKVANASRADESTLIRATLLPAPRDGSTSCASCHAAPAAAGGDREPMRLVGPTKRQADLAHMEGIYGWRGMLALMKASPQVEAALSEPQKAVLARFSCCIVPPQDMRDPTRAGQAEVSADTLEFMRKVRACPEPFWPTMRELILQGADRVTVGVSPGAGEQRKARTRADLAAIVDRVRTLSDTEFEMGKDQLAADARTAFLGEASGWEHKNAYFLLIPGSTRVYSEYIARLAPAPR